MKRVLEGAFALLAVVATGQPQAPTISSVVDAASYQPTLATPGAIITIFGSNLAAATATAATTPLPLQLGGASVTQGGVAAPLLYVSPSQINLQAPNSTGGAFVVATSEGSSSPYNPSVASPTAWYAGGVLTDNGSGCGQGAVLNDASDGSVSVNSTANSASPGDYVSIFGTGLHAISPTPIGSPAPAPSSASSPGGGLAWNFGAPSFSVAALEWSGLAPGLIGVDQVNAQIPATTREGCAVPLQIAYSAMTPPVTVAIHNGGGQCADPPSAGYGQITWQKVVSTTSANTSTETDSMTALLLASPGQQAPAIPTYSDGCQGGVCGASLPNSTTFSGLACAVPGYRSLAAGAMTIQGPRTAPTPAALLPYVQGQLSGISAYQANLPSGSVSGGGFSVTAAGGSDIGAFQSSLQIGTDIQFQTQLAGADAFGNCQPLVVNWTGGDPKSWITLSFVNEELGAYGDYQQIMFAYQTHTSDGTMNIPLPVSPPSQGPCQTSPGPITIRVEIDPDPSEIQAFSATGLSLGGQATWRYVYNFQATMELP